MYERRLLRVFFAIAAVLVVVLARAFHLQVVASDDIVRAGEATLRSTRLVHPRRGEILWADGTPAVRNASRCVARLDRKLWEALRFLCGRCGAEVSVDPAPAGSGREPAAPDQPCRDCGAPGPWTPRPRPDVRALAEILGVDAREFADHVELVLADGRRRNWRILDLLPETRLSRETALRFAARAVEFPGVDVRTEPCREADPEIRGLAGHASLAYDTDVRELVSEARDAAGLHRYTENEARRLVVGHTGLERVHDERLRGIPGIVESAPSTARDERPEKVVVREPADGAPLRTTLVRSVQAVAREIVRKEGTAVSAVVLDLTDGAIVAIADSGNDAYFHPIQGIAPGSVFKLVPALAMLETGIDPDATLDCAGQGMLRRAVRYKCVGVHPGIALREAFAKSCNHFFMHRAEDSGPRAMADAYSRLGFDVTPRLGLGVASRVGRIDDFGAHTAQLGIGQAQALASPLQVATAYARLATRGRRIVPYFDRDAGPAPGSRETDPVIARHADRLLDCARLVVTGGTGHRIAGLVALEAAGKSGTAEVDEKNSAGVRERRNHAWFVAFAPASAPRYVAVVVHESVPREVGGSTLAGPDVARLLEAALRER